MGAEVVYQACCERRAIATTSLERKLGEAMVSTDVRMVDQAALRGVMPRHPRLRRASGVTKFAITAAAEALGEELIGRVQQGEKRIGIVMSLINGCVNYSNRFYTEVLAEPSLASPILFPETVYNAPASHVASYLSCDGPVYTLIGDSAAWFTAMDVARGWLENGQVDGCLVLCAEELDWLNAEALGLYSRELVATEGAAAVYLESGGSDVCLDSLHGPYDYRCAAEKRQAVAEAWREVSVFGSDLLVDGLTGVKRIDRDEGVVIQDWDGKRVSPAEVLGSGMGSGCGFQTVVALEALKGGYNAATVLAAGNNQHAYIAQFTRR